MKFNLALLTSFCLLSSAVYSAPGGSSQENYEIIVNNRILAKVQEQTISVIDVMKKMDVFLNQYYPEVAENPMARFQYYTSQWRSTLAQMIDNELIMADAEAKQVKISDGDLRESIQERFGPNIMATLDKIGLSYEEARKMVLADMIVQRMTWFKINSKAIQSVNPKDIKLAYQRYCEENPSTDEFEYQIVSVRSQDPSVGAKTAELIHNLLSDNKISLDNLQSDLSSHVELDQGVTIQVSEPLKGSTKDLSQSYKEVLISLPTHTFSLPVLQKSRVDQGVSHRIFFVKDHIKKEVPRFEKIAADLENHLIKEAIDKESAFYIKKLRKYFGYDDKSLEESIPPNFQPFTLK